MTSFKNLLPIILLASTGLTHADEGQWQPYQLPQLKAELKRIGITTSPGKLGDLSRSPLGAIVALPGCSASFVSPDGLVVTNHHCGYGAVQRNSSAAHNYIADGFLAKTRAEELPAGPNERIYVTDKIEDVTLELTQDLKRSLSPRARHDEIQNRIKALVAQCEKDPSYRCSVPSFHRGLEYYLIRQMMIRDVRLVYAPAEGIGNFGGDIDNYEWPRQTGDFSFLRAYVGKDGKPADPSPDNVPYRSKKFLVVSAEGLKTGDPVLLAGYPGRTSRYKLPVEIRAARDVAYPLQVAALQADIDTIAKSTAANPEWTVRYASVEKSLQNRMKKTRGLLDAFARKDIVAIKVKQDAEFRTWLKAQPGATQIMLSELDRTIAADIALSNEEYAWSLATNSELLKSAHTVYRLALEKQKPDAQREPGYQQRDQPFIKARLTRLEQSLVGTVDQARWQTALQHYRALPAAMHPAGLDALLPANNGLDALYRHSQLANTAQRLGWIDADAATIARSDDALLQLAVKLNAIATALEERRKDLDGKLELVTPRYMQAIIAFKKSQGKPVYPDANSTLRITYGTVAPYAVRDGILKSPFTTVEGILEKDTGKKPFNSPPKLLAAIKAKRYGQFSDPVLGTVPVNFLSSADTTGGNSGSAVMNKDGELVGLNFDSTYESIAKDWYFDSAITRAIHVDIRYMLWVMSEVDHADNLLKEMTIKYK